jgi:hypothetical protein
MTMQAVHLQRQHSSSATQSEAAINGTAVMSLPLASARLWLAAGWLAWSFF